MSAEQRHCYCGFEKSSDHAQIGMVLVSSLRYLCAIIPPQLGAQHKDSSSQGDGSDPPTDARIAPVEGACLGLFRGNSPTRCVEARNSYRLHE